VLQQEDPVETVDAKDEEHDEGTDGNPIRALRIEFLDSILSSIENLSQILQLIFQGPSLLVGHFLECKISFNHLNPVEVLFNLGFRLCN